MQKAFDLIYRKGYQATSVDDILATTQVTKGAFYYHFKNKEEMGLATVNEVIHKAIRPLIIKPLEGNEDFREAIYGMMKAMLNDHTFFKVEYGCPLVNLIDEMAPLSEGFQKTLKLQLFEWQSAIGHVLNKGINAGQLSKDHNAEQIALYIIAGYSGARNIGKIYGREYYSSFLNQFKNYLHSLK